MDSCPKPIANILEQFFTLGILFNIRCTMSIMIQEIAFSPEPIMDISTVHSTEQYLHE